MQKEEYLKVQKRLLSIAMLSQNIDLEGYLSTISSCENIAPILDPTLFRRGATNLRALKNLAEAVIKIQEMANELVSAVAETYVREKEQGHIPPPDSEL